MITALALATSGSLPPTEAMAACPPQLLTGHPGQHPDLTAAVRAALADALAVVPDPVRAQSPMVLAVGSPCTAVASWYALRCQDTRRRLRPSESVKLEVAERIRGAASDGWHGPCFLLASPGVDAGQAVRAGAALRRRHPAVLVGEVLLPGGADDPDGVHTGALVVMAASVAPLGEPDGPAIDLATVPTDLPAAEPTGSLLLALAARLTMVGPR